MGFKQREGRREERGKGVCVYGGGKVWVRGGTMSYAFQRRRRAVRAPAEKHASARGAAVIGEGDLAVPRTLKRP